ncbi:Sodium- and chloride-dependent glycine transporter 2-like 1 [Homarus americanus]|uniref:Sodium-dependent nutrient amino acid transporter 1 n=1 Tax=Homarus americanus TaxID=6706 RepID=A0A8J5N3M3_HOMAM|nr:Sodium- and chloride-dependent glycine transporter 2-like 1 [Homarus americanus]
MTGVGWGMVLLLLLVTIYYNLLLSWALFYIGASFFSPLPWSDCQNDFNTDDYLHSNPEEKSYVAAKEYFIGFTDVVTVHRDITSNSQEAGFQEAEEENVTEVLDSHSEELSTEDLLLLEQQQRMEESTGEGENPAPISLTLKVLSTAMDQVNTAMELLAENDPNIKRSLSVRTMVEKGILCYKKLYLKKKKEEAREEGTYEFHGLLVLCLALAWVLVALCLGGGIRGTGKILYVTVIFPYVVLACLLAINYDRSNDAGRERWLASFSNFNSSELLHLDIWISAASQVIYSLGVAYGGITTLSSYNSLQQNFIRDAVLVCLLDVGTSLLSGFVLFSSTVVLTDKKLEDSHGTSFVMVEAVTTAVFDQFQVLRRNHLPVVMGTCSLLFVLGLPMCTNYGLSVFNLMDMNTSKHSLLMLGFLEVFIVSYIYGFEKMVTNVKKDLRLCVPRPLYWYWAATWTVITPLCLLALTVLGLWSEDWSVGDSLSMFVWGQVIAFGPVFLVPIFGIYKIWTRGDQSLGQLLSATANFCPQYLRNGRDPVTNNQYLPENHFCGDNRAFDLQEL